MSLSKKRRSDAPSGRPPESAHAKKSVCRAKRRAGVKIEDRRA